MNYELKKINLGSLLKNFPIIFVALGTIIGVFTFFVFPTTIAGQLSLNARILSWLIFIALYSIIMFVGVFCVAGLYNIVCAKFGGIILHLELKEG